MDNNSMFPLEVSKADFYYIYPFVLDFQTFELPKNEDSFLKMWALKKRRKKIKVLREHFPLKLGLPETRLAFPPVLPYQALVEEFGHFDKAATSENKSRAPLTIKIKTREGKPLKVENVDVRKTFIIRECGNGALTYKITVRRKKLSQNVANLLNPIIQLVPRLADKKSRDEGEALLKGGVFGEKEKTLFGHVRDELFDLETRLEKCFGDEISNKDKQKREPWERQYIWEDREVLFVEDCDKRPWGLDKPAAQPFPFIVLYLKGKKYNYQAVRSLLAYLSNRNAGDDEVTVSIAKALLSIMYRFKDLNNYDILPELTGTHLLNINRTLNVNKAITCFFHHTSVLAVIDDSNDNEQRFARGFAEKYFIPAILNSIESVVTRAHFAFILDAILDNQIKNLGRASFDQLPLFSEQLAKAKSQMAMFLQNIGQYIKGGNLGTEILTMLDEVLRIEALERKLMDKMDLASQALQGFIHFKYSEDIEKLKKEMSENEG